MHSPEEMEKIKKEIKEEILKELQPLLSDLGKNMLEIKLTLAPMSEIFNSVKGFNGVATWILKALIAFGAALGVLYGAIRWLKTGSTQ